MTTSPLPADFPRLNCVDMSRWGGELTREEALALWDLGVRHIIVGTGDPGGAGLWAKQQAQMWVKTNGARGGTVDAYIYLVFAVSATAQVTAALTTLYGVGVRMWWLDAEDPAAPKDPAANAAFLRACLTVLGATRRVGIYTGRWWWGPWMGPTTEFASFELWNSFYDANPDESGLPYGGWEHSAIEQYQGTTVLAGQSVDLNYAKNLEEDAVTREEYLALVAAQEDALLARWAGSEQRDASPPYAVFSRAQRLEYARGREAAVAAGTAPSLVEIAASVGDHEHGGVKR